ncbi:hypothetical protein [Pasteurella atlantica]|uniref:Uncharacterized protein n=2 Tax=Pasteurellaceae TaxID=712 RepID=A0ACC6HKY2_9PAST|nr:hypothetical protein [Pasteurella atlantica]MDP8051478.1 hypothetical protein [Pasteurella atlantica]MDP8098471.1 hypothetical protein [Pasteurella atlantica]MDP8100913.1 hypothetical protein [Pasteurella atlantica]MDP8104642.1 hypothetical protein [Pasteurella atlantica]MDP8106415.1 hypothetical protein [Pasteurella atlantica]
MALLKILLVYFKVWWIPILFYLVPFFLFNLGNTFKSNLLLEWSDITFLINFLGSFIAAISIIWKKPCFSLLQIIFSLFFLHIILVIDLFGARPDYYGVNKEIPENIEIGHPILYKSCPTLEELKKSDLIIADSFQGGLYTYFTDYQPTETGYFYLKAFEVTSNDSLSDKRLPHQSKILVNDLTRNELYSLGKSFTIYEGSWGDYYGARFELWFVPSNGNPEYKITERNYIIEGWQR